MVPSRAEGGDRPDPGARGHRGCGRQRSGCAKAVEAVIGSAWGDTSLGDRPLKWMRDRLGKLGVTPPSALGRADAIKRHGQGEPNRVDCVRIVHFLRNALDDVPRKVDDDCLQELRWLYDRRDLAEARTDLAAWIGKWQAKYPRLVAWVEDNIEETLTFYRLPRQHHKHLKSTNMLERLNEEIKRRTHVVRIFPNADSCSRP